LGKVSVMRKRTRRKHGIKVVPLKAVPPAALREVVVFDKGKLKKVSAPTSRRKLKVLVVDDDEDLANCSTAILHAAGWECFTVYNASDAIAAADSFAPDVVVSDVVMPGMDGFAACLEIKRNLPACGILLVSGAVATSDVVKQHPSPEYNFQLLPKPVQPERLLAEVSRLTSRSA